MLSVRHSSGTPPMSSGASTRQPSRASAAFDVGWTDTCSLDQESVATETSKSHRRPRLSCTESPPPVELQLAPGAVSKRGCASRADAPASIPVLLRYSVKALCPGSPRSALLSGRYSWMALLVIPGSAAFSSITSLTSSSALTLSPSRRAGTGPPPSGGRPCACPGRIACRCRGGWASPPSACICSALPSRSSPLAPLSSGTGRPGRDMRRWSPWRIRVGAFGGVRWSNWHCSCWQ